MSELRCLLLTDILDSTALTERLGDAASARLNAAQDRVARDLLREWRGREIDKTDGMLALFEDVTDAVGCALAYHRALAALEPPVRARAGLHLGPVTLRANSAADVALGAKPLEVEGLAKPLAARIMTLAGGGQTLLSADARQALRDGDCRVLSHGHWRMKGLSEPVEIFEVGLDGAPFVPPADTAKVYRVVRSEESWQPLQAVPHNLPADRDSFVGRREAQAALAEAFDQGARLVTLLGMGGTGKTRLALRYARLWLGDYPGGVWFCDLSAARELDEIVQTLARSLEVPLGSEPPVAQLGAALAARGHCLVILDNFEQLTRHAHESLGCWLDAAPDARFLVTSRELLGLSGEQSLPLPPLNTAEAMELFLRRAARGPEQPAPGAGERAILEQLVQLLDGLPLAIELAAARARVMSPAAMLGRMHERFRLLAAPGARRDRQATLRATFDWSWDLLREVERAALAQLSVFEGGFTLAAAEAVLDLSACADDAWAVDVVQSLLDKSFLHVARPDRLDLLTSVQAYAGEQLARPESFPGSGSAGVRAARARHSAWAASLGPRRAVADACVELANLVAGCRRAVEDGAASLAVAALHGAWEAVSRYGPLSQGLELAEAVCALQPRAARARAVLGQALRLLGRPAEARQQLLAAQALAAGAGERLCEVEVMSGLADLQRLDGDLAGARQTLDAAGVMAAELGAVDARCGVLNLLATVALENGRLAEARARFEEALALLQTDPDSAWGAALHGNLGMLLANAGQLDAAGQALEQGLALAGARGDRRAESEMLCNLGMLYLVQGRLVDAIARSRAALEAARLLGHRQAESIVRCNLGLALLESGRLDEAVGHFEAALHTMRELGERRYEAQTLGYLGRACAELGRYDAARECFARGEALCGGQDDPLSLGILCCERACCEWRAGDADAARRALAAAETLAGAAGVSEASELGQVLSRTRSLIGASNGER